MKILYLTDLPTPYRTRLLSMLAEKTELTALFERKTASYRNAKWLRSDGPKPYREVFLHGIRRDNRLLFSPEPLPYLLKRWDRIVIGGYSTVTDVLSILLLRLLRRPFIISCDGILPKQTDKKKTALKRLLISSAACVLSTNDVSTQLLRAHGAKKVCLYPFSSVLEADVATGLFDKQAYKKKIGCGTEKMALYVGQMIHRKGVDCLTEAFRTLDPERYSLFLVGGKTASTEGNVHYVDFKQKDELEDYYRAADVFVLPTREDIWGLVVNEALARGLPVVTTDNCGAGLAMIRDGYNGYLAPVEDSAALADRIEKVCTAPDYEAMCMHALETAREYTIEKMAQRTLEILGQEG